MARPPNEDLIKPWKINLPATTAGCVEHLLFDPIHNRPRYGVRAKLVDALLLRWLAYVQGNPISPMPTLDEVRNA